MGQVLGQDFIQPFQFVSTTQVKLPAGSRVTVGGQQYANLLDLFLNTATAGMGGLDAGALGANQVWYLHAAQVSGALAIIASLSKTAPTGVTTFTWTGWMFFTNGSSQIQNVSLFKPYWAAKIGSGSVQPGLTADAGAFTNIVDANVSALSSIVSTGLSFSLVGGGGLGVTGTLDPGVYRVLFSISDNTTWVPPTGGSVGGRAWRIAQCSGSGLCSVSTATYSAGKSCSQYFNQSTGGSIGPAMGIDVEGDFVITSSGTYTFNLQKSNTQALNGGSLMTDYANNTAYVMIRAVN